MDANQRQRQISAILAGHAEGLKFIDANGVLEDIYAAGVIEYHEFFDIIDKNATKKVLFLRKVVPLKGDGAFSALVDSLRNRGHIALANSLENGVTFICLFFYLRARDVFISET